MRTRPLLDAAVVLALAMACAACSRTPLTGASSDDGGGADAGEPEVPATDPGACNASTCPGGCCDPSGACQPGTDVAACGALGEACRSCSDQGFPACDPHVHACAKPVGTCDAQTCPGCCRGGVCFAGGDPDACGSGGESCQQCASAGLACIGSQCVQPTCGPASCRGCCYGDACLAGTDQDACGAGGAACTPCSAAGGTCSAPGGIGGACSVAVDAGLASPRCSDQDCPGCCDGAGRCQPGILDAQCGQGGDACSDCTRTRGTCGTAGRLQGCVRPGARACPGTYPACPAGMLLPLPTRQRACAPADLASAASACAAGAHTVDCQAFFQAEASATAACASCLAPFDYDFAEVAGLFECAAPFVDATCGHDAACAVDCTQAACRACAGADATAACGNAVRSGACMAYYRGAQCMVQALSGPAAFCNPDQDGGASFGTWLGTVGSIYCGQ